MRYPAGSTVQVHYDPKDRTIAAVGSGEGRMIHVEKRKFTEAEELVRVTGPFHTEIVAEIESQGDLPALQHRDSTVDLGYPAGNIGSCSCGILLFYPL